MGSCGCEAGHLNSRVGPDLPAPVHRCQGMFQGRGLEVLAQPCV